MNTDPEISKEKSRVNEDTIDFHSSITSFEVNINNLNIQINKRNNHKEDEEGNSLEKYINKKELI